MLYIDKAVQGYLLVILGIFKNMWKIKHFLWV